MLGRYYPAFQRAIRDGGALGIMYACNEVNGVPPAGSVFLRNALDSMGFDGYRCSDGGQVGSMCV